MKHYLLSIYQPDEETPEPEFLDKVMRDRGGEVLMTDGPSTEGKEHVGGLWIIKAPDLDAALEWARRAARATTLPIEVRPFHNESEG